MSEAPFSDISVRQQEKTGKVPTGLWKKLCRHKFTKKKLSTKNLTRLCQEWASDELTLVVHSEDVDHAPFFPNAYTVTKREDVPADMHVGLYYEEMSEIPSESYNVILCTGLLEHIPDPDRLLTDLKRILKPGGRLIISASAIFAFHESPNNFFHFTPNGFKLLFKDWSHFEMLRGASQPFETIGILLQRIHLQSDINPFVRPFVEILFHLVPLLDYTIVAQYDTRQRRDASTLTDTMLPSNVQAVVVK